MKNKGLIFNIQRYSVHDGHGIRTVIFFKGCPLRCPWCSNPELRLGVEPTTWIKNNQEETIGKWMTTEDIIDEVIKDDIFYRTSGGGVTLSGGEVLIQAEFAASLLQELHYLGIDTALETTGSVPLTSIQLITPYLNHVLFDLKIMDTNQAKKVLGIDTKLVAENFDFIHKNDSIELTPRVPLIPEFIDNETNINQICHFLLSRSLHTVHLLPFHQYGSNKYTYLGWEYTMKDVPTLTEDTILSIQQIFESHHILAVVDGLD